MSFYIDNNNYCIGKLCLHTNENSGFCEHVVLNKGQLEVWDIFKIRQELGHKMTDHEHFYTNKISKSVSATNMNEKELEMYKIFYKYKF